jgi:hypothetical protein
MDLAYSVLGSLVDIAVSCEIERFQILIALNKQAPANAA